MNAIALYPADVQEFAFLKKLMRQLNVRFAIEKQKKVDDSLFTKEAYFAMLDERIKSAEQGKYTTLRNKQELHQFLEQL